MPGFIDVNYVKIMPRTRGAYSSTSMNFNQQLSADGRFVSVPDNVCMELKYPDADIKGTIE